MVDLGLRNFVHDTKKEIIFYKDAEPFVGANGFRTRVKPCPASAVLAFPSKRFISISCSAKKLKDHFGLHEFIRIFSNQMNKI